MGTNMDTKEGFAMEKDSIGDEAPFDALQRKIYSSADFLWLFSLYSLHEVGTSRFHSIVSILGDLTTHTGCISVTHSGLVILFYLLIKQLLLLNTILNY